MDESIRTALTDQLTRCEARCARLQAELDQVTAAMQQSDAANVALAAKLERATAVERERCAAICDDDNSSTGRHLAQRIRSGEP